MTVRRYAFLTHFVAHIVRQKSSHEIADSAKNSLTHVFRIRLWKKNDILDPVTVLTLRSPDSGPIVAFKFSFKYLLNNVFNVNLLGLIRPGFYECRIRIQFISCRIRISPSLSLFMGITYSLRTSCMDRDKTHLG